MYWDMIDERIKGFTYAHQSERLISLKHREVIFAGKEHLHTLVNIEGTWHCDCAAYAESYKTSKKPWCRHTIALERILASTLCPVPVTA
jgi:hypothetical protein